MMKAQLFAIALLASGLNDASALTIGATWTSANPETRTATATLGSATISIANISSPSIAAGSDFSGTDFSAAPLTPTSSSLSNYEVGSNYTATFDLPVSGLMIYAQNWRGNSTTPYTYTFNHPVVILSGFADCTVSGNTLTVPTSFRSGILAFTEPVKTLAVQMNTSSNGGQIMSLGVIPRVTSVQLSGSAKPKTKGTTYTLRGTADATYGIQSLKIKVGKTSVKAKGTAKWTCKVRLPGKTTKVQIQAVSNTGELSAATRVTITRK